MSAPAMIKPEPGVPIKPEPSDSSIPAHVKHEGSDDDEYEDAGDLEMGNGKRGLWLVKLPKFLLEQWEKMDDDEEITLGEILVSQDEKVCFVSLPRLLRRS